MKKRIPSFDIYKTLGNDASVIFQHLEASYHEYDSNQAHRHNYYEIIYFETSGGEHEIDFITYPIKAHALHLICPDQVHVLRRKANVTGYILAFSSDLLFALSQSKTLNNELLSFESLSASPIMDLSASSKTQLVELMQQLQTECKNKDESRALMLSLLVCQLLILIKRNSSATQLTNKNSRLYLEFKKLVKQHFLKVSAVSEYAKMLCISAGHLNDSIKAASGKNAKALIQEHIELEAKRLLYHSDQTIKEIAFHLNFEDASHFTRSFKKATGSTPLEFRNDTREKYH
jgi:AraC family transcriptional regulator, transcriptional activator of pobA